MNLQNVFGRILFQKEVREPEEVKLYKILVRDKKFPTDVRISQFYYKSAEDYREQHPEGPYEPIQIIQDTMTKVN